MLPDGSMFKYVSCPHMLAEILIYVGLAIFMHFQNYGWILTTIWVFSNQVCLLKHYVKLLPINNETIFLNVRIFISILHIFRFKLL